MSLLPALMPTPGGKKKGKKKIRNYTFDILENMGQSWKEPVWEEGDVTGGSLGWQQETFSYIVIESGEARGTNTGLREFLPTLWVETASQLCSLILQLNSIQGEIRVKLGVCRCARTFGGWTEGWRQWAIGAAPLPSTFHPCAA